MILQDFNNLRLIQTFRLFQLMICSIFQNINIMASSTDHPCGFRFSFSYLFILFRLLPIERKAWCCLCTQNTKHKGKIEKQKLLFNSLYHFSYRKEQKRNIRFSLYQKLISILYLSHYAISYLASLSIN